MNGKRPITFDEAKRTYVHRYTMEHKPTWANGEVAGGRWHYAPQFQSDREWYELSRFNAECIAPSRRPHMETGKPTWPLGERLAKPFKVGDPNPPSTPRELYTQALTIAGRMERHAREVAETATRDAEAQRDRARALLAQIRAEG